MSSECRRMGSIIFRVCHAFRTLILRQYENLVCELHKFCGFCGGKWPWTNYSRQSSLKSCEQDINEYSTPQVAWIRHRDLHILTVGTYTYTTDQRFQTSYHRDIDEWTLQIKWAQQRDAGVYECQISTQPVRSYSVNLNIVGEYPLYTRKWVKQVLIRQNIWFIWLGILEKDKIKRQV